MNKFRRVLSALVGIERFIVIALLLVAVIGCISVGNIFGAIVSGILAAGFNAFYMLMMDRKKAAEDGDAGPGATTLSTHNQSAKTEPDHIERMAVTS